ncbi:MAG TPA: hypothetical protein VFR11_08645 [Micromonosporaceae bacterium]|jgi:hypothetical protein|nr:hypothetical protein [Micromonosporaceae bacterium]
MFRTKIAAPALIGVLVLTAGCGAKSTPTGSGVLQPVSGTSAATPPTGATTSTPTSKPTSKPTTSTSDWPANPDCVSYNPNNLTVDGNGASGTFIISDGNTVVIRVHGQTDDVGKEALALAQRYKRHCFIGRNNTRDEKGDFIFDYWRDPSGNLPPIPNQDQLCSEYNNKNLTVEDMGDGDGWRVKDHDDVLQEFDNKSDALGGDIVFKKYSQKCEIGDVEDSDNNLGQVDFQL